MKTFWDGVGKILAKLAKAAGEGALWASQHPEVVGTVATLAGHPEVAAVVKAAAPVTEAIGGAIQQQVNKK